MPEYNVLATQIASNILYQASLAGLGNSMLFAPSSIATGDINGDGFNDIFCTPWISGYQAKPLVLIGDGTGKFTDQTSKYFSSSVAFDVAKTVSIADFNSDGMNDLMVFDTGSEDPSDFVNGNFPGAKNQYFLQTSTGFVSQSLPNNGSATFNHTSATADMDADGDIDYLGTQLGGPNFTGFGLTLGENVAGQITDNSSLLPIEIRYKLSANWSLYTGLNFQVPGAVSAADMNNDGRNDIITASYGQDNLTGQMTVRISSQNADGTFSQQIVGTMPQALKDKGFAGAVSVSAGDIDGDGKKDLAIVWEAPGKSAVQILHNDGNGFSDVTTSILGSNLFREVNVRDATGNYAPMIAGAKLIDVDHNGFADLVLSQMGSSPDQYLNSAGHATGDSLFLNDKAGHLIGWTPNLTSTQFVNAVGATDHPWGAGDPVMMDVNGDSALDMVFIDGVNGSTITVNSLIAALQTISVTSSSNGQTLSSVSGVVSTVTVDDANVLVKANGVSNTVNLKGDGTWSSGYSAFNAGDNGHNGTGETISISGKTKCSTAVESHGNTTINLTAGSDAFFLEDAFSGLNPGVATQTTTYGVTGARVLGDNITINAGDGNDVVDLTGVLTIGDVLIIGGNGDDVLWSSLGNDAIKGGGGNDTLFGGQGINHLNGGAGCDIFQFAQQGVSNDYVEDFTMQEDKLKLFGVSQADVHVAFHADTHSVDLDWGNHMVHVNVIGVMPTTLTEFVLL